MAALSVLAQVWAGRRQAAGARLLPRAVLPFSSSSPQQNGRFNRCPTDDDSAPAAHISFSLLCVFCLRRRRHKRRRKASRSHETNQFPAEPRGSFTSRSCAGRRRKISGQLDQKSSTNWREEGPWAATGTETPRCAGRRCDKPSVIAWRSPLRRGFVTPARKGRRREDRRSRSREAHCKPRC